jgi:hypothetical protein
MKQTTSLRTKPAGRPGTKQPGLGPQPVRARVSSPSPDQQDVIDFARSQGADIVGIVVEFDDEAAREKFASAARSTLPHLVSVRNED